MIPKGFMYYRHPNEPWSSAIRNAKRAHRRAFGNGANVIYHHADDAVAIKLCRTRMRAVVDEGISIRGTFTVCRERNDG